MKIGTGKNFLIILSPTAISQKSSHQPRGTMENEKYGNSVSESVSRPASFQYATAGNGYFSGTCAQLIKDIDEGWRYFWKKRGYDPPPDHWGNDSSFWFGREGVNSEKKSAEESKQKEAERVQGVQRARREFLKGQGLREVRKKA